MIFPEPRETYSVFLGRCFGYFENRGMQFLNDQDIEILARSAWDKIARKKVEGQNIDRIRSQGFQRDLLVLDDQIYLYGAIGAWDDEVGFDNVQRAVANLETDRIGLRINTPGGDVMEGFAVMRFLRRQERPIDTWVDSQALSMGAVFAMMGEQRTMALESKLMIHHAHTISMGDYRDFRREAEILEGLSADIVNIIENASLMDSVEIWKAMDNETWYNADQALDNGMATDVDRRALSGGQIENLSPKQWGQLNRSGYCGKRYTEEIKARIDALRAAVH